MRAPIVVMLTGAALCAFAANSVLCRLALANGAIDPYAFTTVRLGAGALALLLLTSLTGRTKKSGKHGSWWDAGFLVVYALPFSLAYVQLDTGTGALLLFGAVQLTMIGVGVMRGERPRLVEWIGLAGAAGGVVYLLVPGVTSPNPLGAAFMVTAGIGWGLYSIAGQSGGDPARRTAANFRRALLLIAPAMVLALGQLHVSWPGALAAMASGALASGLGYAVWYAALRDLTATRAALVQLLVPVIASAGGVLFLGETVTTRLAVAALIILGSIALSTLAKRRSA